MSDKSEIVDEAKRRFGQKLLIRARIRTVAAVVLLILGGALMYIGFSEQQYVYTVFGIIFVLYGLFMRFHVRKTKAIMKELEAEIAKLEEEQTEDEKQHT